MFVRLFRALPLFALLAIVAGVVYVVVAWRESPTRAKEILIKVFTVLTGALTIFFVLASLYALADKNPDVLDLFLTFLIVAAAALIVTLICRVVFLKNHPSYKRKPTPAHVIRRWPWRRR